MLCGIWKVDIDTKKEMDNWLADSQSQFSKPHSMACAVFIYFYRIYLSSIHSTTGITITDVVSALSLPMSGVKEIFVALREVIRQRVEEMV